MPFFSEPVEGEVFIQAPEGLMLYKRDKRGKKKEIPMRYEDGRYHINLDKSLETYWLFLERE